MTIIPQRRYEKYLAAFFIVLPAFLAAACDKSTPETSSYIAPSEPFPYLGSSASFAVLSAKNVTNAGSSIVYGDIGVSPGSGIQGITTIKMTGGSVHQNDSLAGQAQNDSSGAYNHLRQKTCDHDLSGLSGMDLGGLTLTPGAYCFSATTQLTGTLTLDARGDPSADFVFQINGNLTTAPSSLVQMAGGGESCYVFWQVSGTAELGDASVFAGSILAVGDTTLGNGAMMNGKVISSTGTVSLNSSQIYNNTCPWE